MSAMRRNLLKLWHCSRAWTVTWAPVLLKSGRSRNTNPKADGAMDPQLLLQLFQSSRGIREPAKQTSWVEAELGSHLGERRFFKNTRESSWKQLWHSCEAAAKNQWNLRQALPPANLPEGPVALCQQEPSWQPFHCTSEGLKTPVDFWLSKPAESLAFCQETIWQASEGNTLDALWLQTFNLILQQVSYTASVSSISAGCFGAQNVSKRHCLAPGIPHGTGVHCASNALEDHCHPPAEAAWHQPFETVKKSQELSHTDLFEMFSSKKAELFCNWLFFCLFVFLLVCWFFGRLLLGEHLQGQVKVFRRGEPRNRQVWNRIKSCRSQTC